MARLTIKTKKEIINAIVKGHFKKKEKSIAQLQEELQELFIKNLPAEIIHIYNKYYKSTDIRKRAFWIQLPETKKTVYAVLPKFYSTFLVESNLLRTGLKNEKLILCKTAEISAADNSLRRSKDKLHRELNCIMRTIYTENKLKKEFPEAYKYLEEINKKAVTENSCDKIEELRAKLSRKE